jgi:hypothetical protein
MVQPKLTPATWLNVLTPMDSAVAVLLGGLAIPRALRTIELAIAFVLASVPIAMPLLTFAVEVKPTAIELDELLVELDPIETA